MKIGYARVSTVEQNLDRQIDNLKAQGCERIYTEKRTGKNLNRPEYEKMMAAFRPGDTLVIDSFSRLSRSTRDLLRVIDELDKQGIHVVSVKEQLDTTTPQGKLMLTMLSALAQFERDIILERTNDGLKAARARGRMGGRPALPSAKVDKALKMYDSKKFTVKEIAETTGISVPTLYRRIKDRGEPNRLTAR